MLNLGHKNLNTWTKSLDLIDEIYSLCKKLLSDEKYILVSQLKRAAISVSSNIAEGYARKSKNETKRFLDIARSSLVEIDTQFTICLRLHYLSKKDLKKEDELLNHNFALITKLSKSIETN